MKANLLGFIGVMLLPATLLVGCGKNAPEQPAETNEHPAKTDSGQKRPETTNAEGIRITSVEPDLAEIGENVTISGQGFGNEQDHTVSIGGNGISVKLEVVEWQDDKIVAKIPNDPKIQQNQSYYYRVQSNDYKESSNLFNFSFK